MTRSFSPNGADVASGICIAVYQNGMKLTSVQGTNASTPGTLTVAYSSTTAGSVLIQIGNYNAEATISYTLSR